MENKDDDKPKLDTRPGSAGLADLTDPVTFQSFFHRSDGDEFRKSFVSTMWPHIPDEELAKVRVNLRNTPTKIRIQLTYGKLVFLTEGEIRHKKQKRDDLFSES